MSIIEETDGNIDKIFKYNRNDEKQLKDYFKKYSVNNSDHLTILNIYKELYLKNKFIFGVKRPL